MRITQLERPTPRPPEATAFLERQQKLDEGIEFDPHRDITQQNWDEIMRWQRKERKNSERIFISIAMELSLIFPERKKELELKIDYLNSSTLKTQLKEFRKREDWATSWSSFSSLAVPLAVLFPKHRGELGLDNEVLEGLKKDFEHDRKAFGLLSALHQTLALAILFPGRKETLVPWKTVKDKLPYHLNFPLSGNAESLVMMRLALLYPEHRVELGLDNNMWGRMKEHLASCRKEKDWTGFIHNAFNLVILAAQDACITSDGQIRITPKKPKLANAPAPLPQRPR